jgi:hypothetical protein
MDMEGMQSAASDLAHDFLAYASVAANPPSDGGRDDEEYDAIDTGSQINNSSGYAGNEDVIPFDFNEVSSELVEAAAPLRNDLVCDSLRHINSQHIDNAPMTNRERQYNTNCDSVDGDESADLGGIVDGFDFDKNEPSSPFDDPRFSGNLLNDDSFRNLPSDPWSPQGNMQISPLQVSSVTTGQQCIGDNITGNLSHRMALPMHELNSIPSTSQPKSIDVRSDRQDSEATPLLVARKESQHSFNAVRQSDDCGSNTFLRGTLFRFLY